MKTLLTIALILVLATSGFSAGGIQHSCIDKWTMAHVMGSGAIYATGNAYVDNEFGLKVSIGSTFAWELLDMGYSKIHRRCPPWMDKVFDKSGGCWGDVLFGLAGIAATFYINERILR